MSKMREKGITLVALVVTVIILLILAGVTISQISGNNGLFSRVKKAVEGYQNAQSEEEIALGKLEKTLEDSNIGNNEREENKGETLEKTTAQPEDVLAEKSYYDGNKILQEGLMENHGGNNIEVTNKETSIPKGYYNGEGKILVNNNSINKCVYYGFGADFGSSSSWTDKLYTSDNITDSNGTQWNGKIENDCLIAIGEKNEMLFQVVKPAKYSIYWYRNFDSAVYSRLCINNEIVATGSFPSSGATHRKYIVWSKNLNYGDIIKFEAYASNSAYDSIVIFATDTY